MIAEFYAKGMDVGLANVTGAGWIVQRQEDRGLFYENYALGLLRNPAIVGWQWFKYMDNDPFDLTADPSNLNSNKGIVSIQYQSYEPVLRHMGAVNNALYELADFLIR